MIDAIPLAGYRVVLRCDRCLAECKQQPRCAVSPSRAEVEAFRRLMEARLGWRRYRDLPGDYCPVCVAEIDAAREVFRR